MTSQRVKHFFASVMSQWQNKWQKKTKQNKTKTKTCLLERKEGETEIKHFIDFMRTDI